MPSHNTCEQCCLRDSWYDTTRPDTATGSSSREAKTKSPNGNIIISPSSHRSHSGRKGWNAYGQKASAWPANRCQPSPSVNPPGRKGLTNKQLKCWVTARIRRNYKKKKKAPSTGPIVLVGSNGNWRNLSWLSPAGICLSVALFAVATHCPFRVRPHFADRNGQCEPQRAQPCGSDVSHISLPAPTLPATK